MNQRSENPLSDEESAIGVELSTLFSKYRVHGAVIAYLSDNGEAKILVTAPFTDERGMEFITSFGPYAQNAMSQCIKDKVSRN